MKDGSTDEDGCSQRIPREEESQGRDWESHGFSDGSLHASSGDLSSRISFHRQSMKRAAVLCVFFYVELILHSS